MNPLLVSGAVICHEQVQKSRSHLRYPIFPRLSLRPIHLTFLPLWGRYCLKGTITILQTPADALQFSTEAPRHCTGTWSTLHIHMPLQSAVEKWAKHRGTVEPNRLIISCCWQEPQRGWVGGCRGGVKGGGLWQGFGENGKRRSKEREREHKGHFKRHSSPM